MFIKMIIAVVSILTLLIAWLMVQHLARLVAKQYPEWGSAREEGQGCGKNCGCSNKTSCKKIK